MAIDLTNSERSELTERILGTARNIGFDLAGVVPATPLVEERRRLEEWLQAGYHASMRWMERDVEKRTDPAILFHGAQSVVVVALNYYTPHAHSNDPERGRISRYAWGDDYHDVMGEKLKLLLARIREICPEVEGKACADIQPMMDKAWAVRAGIGWIGKHSNLITRTKGSWVFIGELILNIPLAYNLTPHEDHCGTCNLCIEACPTGAITEPYVVDSNLCISHATIELRDEDLPATVVNRLEGWLYGCDTCQDVCPWNRFEEETGEQRFQPREDNVNPRLHSIASMTHDEYVVKFRRSAIKRARLSGLQRNARSLQAAVQRRSDNEDEGS